MGVILCWGMVATLEYSLTDYRLWRGGRLTLLTGVKATAQNLQTAFRTERRSFPLDSRIGFPANQLLRTAKVSLRNVAEVVDDVALRCSGVRRIHIPSSAALVNIDGIETLNVTGLVVVDQTGEELEIEPQELPLG